MSKSFTKDINIRAIVATCSAVNPESDASGLLCIADSESRLQHKVDSTHEADRIGAIKCYERNKATIYRTNPWVNQAELWLVSRGMFQHMVANHLFRWDSNADPRSLWHPVIATFVAARLWNRHVEDGASTLYELFSGWAGGKRFWERDSDIAARTGRLKNAASRLGFSQDIVSRHPASFGLSGFGTEASPWDKGVLASVSESIGIPSVQPVNLPRDWSHVMPSDLGRESHREIGFAQMAIIAMLGFALVVGRR